MRREGPAALLVALILLSAPVPARCGESPPKVDAAYQVATEVEAAHRAGDARTIERLAARADVDPWLVLDGLESGAAVEAARAYVAARAVPGAEALRRYAAQMPAHPAHEPVRAAAVAARRALGAGRAAEARALIAAVEPLPKNILGLRVGVLAAKAQADAEPRRAVQRLVAIAEAAKRIGWLRGAVGALAALHRIAIAHGVTEEGLAAADAAIGIARRLGDGAVVARSLFNRARMFEHAGNPVAALTAALEAERAARAAGGELIQHELSSLQVQVAAQLKLNQYSAAWLTAKRALARSASSGSLEYRRTAHTHAGSLARYLDRTEEARLHLRKALELHGEDGAKDKRAELLLELAFVLSDQEALAALSRARALFAELGDRRSEARALFRIASREVGRGRVDEAISKGYDEVERLAAELGDDTLATDVRLRKAYAYAELHDTSSALEVLMGGLDALDEGSDPLERVRVTAALAWLAGASGLGEQAVAWARDAAETVLGLVEGHSREEGAAARETWSRLMQNGILSSRTAGDPEALCFFIEAMRAGSLREGLAGREALRSAVIPTDLLRALQEARIAQQRAHQALRRAKAGRSLKNVRTKKIQLGAARSGLLAIVRRIETEAKSAAAIEFPRPDDLADIQKRLRAGEAVILYCPATVGVTSVKFRGERGTLQSNQEAGQHRSHTNSLALVIEKKRARIVPLSKTFKIGSAVDVLLTPDEDAKTAYAVGPMTEADIAHLRAMVVDPLHLGPAIRRVYVSPTGRLAYAPFALLFPEREVVYVPSATTLGLLLRERALRGSGVLAVGDPDYATHRGRASTAHIRRSARGGLAPLPATRKEVERVGTTKLLGADATESRIRKALASNERWHAVHFACHGLVDPDRPMLSSLAVTADDEDDGLLTCLEVFQLRVPADLVVLSACETGRGRVYLMEGILGLPRAFMFAGAPRVMVSLWEVDDEATQALMVKFYSLWTGETGAAAALKQAQAFVRSHEKWKHPYYWAAWVLWGLAD